MPNGVSPFKDLTRFESAPWPTTTRVRPNTLLARSSSSSVLGCRNVFGLRGIDRAGTQVADPAGTSVSGKAS